MNDRLPLRDRTLVLRILVPGLEARLRDKMKEMGDTAAKHSNPVTPRSQSPTNSSSGTKDLYLDLEGVVCEPTNARGGTLWSFHCDGATYPARLVNLPCPVELHKTHDHAIYYKSADIAQMLIVYEDEMALEEAEEKPVEGFPSYYHSGLTPPMRRVVESRFRANEHKALPPPRAAVSSVENELLELMEKLGKDEKAKRSKVPTLTSAVKVLEEVETEIVDYEPWMSDFGRQPHGIEFNTDDPVCSSHPEVWLSAAEIREIQAKKRAEQEEEDRKKRKKEKKSTKKGIPARSSQDTADKPGTPIIQEATTDGVEALDNFDMDDDKFFSGLDDLEEELGLESIDQL